MASINFLKKICVPFVVVYIVFVRSGQGQGENFYYGSCQSRFEVNPSDCGSYFECNFGLRLLRKCSPPLHWNPRITACDWPASAACKEESVANTDTDQDAPEQNGLEFDPPQEIGSVEPTQLEENCMEGSFSSNPEDCNSYYICNHGKLVLQNCGAGLQWNSQHNRCDWPNAVTCDGPGGQGQSSSQPGGQGQSSSQPGGQGQSSSQPGGQGQSSSQPEGQAQGSSQPGSQDQSSPTAPEEPPTTTTNTTQPAVAPVAAQPTPWASGLKLICYFTDWAWYRPLPSGKYLPSDIDPSLCTHIVYSFGLLNGNDFVIQPADTWADFDNGFYEKVTSLKSGGAKVTLALGGWNDSGGSKYSTLVNDPAKRATFVTSTVAYLQKYNFDGLDLDWEYPSCWQGNCKEGLGDKAGFAALVKELRAALPADSLLTAAVSASKLIIDVAYDVPTLSKYLNWIGVMTYDFHGNWDKVTGHVAPLYYTPEDAVPFYNDNSSIYYWMESGAAPDKLVLGIPLYGQSFTLASSANHGLNAPTVGPGQAGTYTRQGGILAYYEICSQSWTVVQDAQGRMGPYGYNGNQWVSYDDVAMVTKKANYVKEHGLAGGMIWALDMDDFTNVCGQGKYPLLSAIAKVLKL